MRISLFVIGKTSDSYLKEGIAKYEKLLSKYCKFNLEILPDVKNAANLPVKELKAKEGEVFLKYFQPNDFVILMDEKGQEFSSVGFSEFINKTAVNCRGNIVFAIGGAFGFGENVHARANGTLSLSKMTFSHQIVRVVFLEQLFRMFTILKGDPYHH